MWHTVEHNFQYLLAMRFLNLFHLTFWMIFHMSMEIFNILAAPN